MILCTCWLRKTGGNTHGNFLWRNLEKRHVFYHFYTELRAHNIKRVNQNKFSSEKETYLVSFKNENMYIFVSQKNNIFCDSVQKEYHLKITAPICEKIISEHMQ